MLAADDLPTAPHSTNDGDSGPLALALTQIMNFGVPLENHLLTDEAADTLRNHIESGADLGAIDEAMAPLGRFLAACAGSEETLAVLLATLLNPHEPARIVPILDRMPTSVKIQQLRSALPGTPYYKTFLKKAEHLFQVRNKAAHGQVRTWKVTAANVEYGLWIKSEQSYVDIADARLLDLLHQAKLLAASATAATLLVSSRFPAREMSFGDLVLSVAAALPIHIDPADGWVAPMIQDWYPDAASAIVD